LIKDAIADITLQQVLTRATDFDIIVTLNLNGDYISDALAAQVGGIGIAPGSNVNYLTGHAIFEATHGTAPKYSDKDMVNLSSVILSGEMMLRYMGWNDAADLILQGVNGAIQAKTVTYDFHRLMPDATKLSTSGFADAVIEHMNDDALADEAAGHYDELADRAREIFEASAEKTQEFIQSSMETAREQLTAAGTFTEDQGQRLKSFLEHDLSRMAESMRDEAKSRLNPSRLTVGAMASLSAVMKAAGSAINDLASKADQGLHCRSGEITSAGTLTCIQCGKEMHFKKTGRIPPCTECHHTEFLKSY